MTCPPSPNAAADAAPTPPTATARPMAALTSAHSTPAETTATHASKHGADATALASIRRRLAHPEPGTVNRLRAEQRAVLHAILGRGA